MGEYATFRGERIKIGTCESLYYLRADQAAAVDYEVDLSKPSGLRFRFPFPDEDEIEPGAFERYNRSIPLWGLTPPAELAGEHYDVQFKADAGYLLSVPCPESGRCPVRFGRNGFGGAVRLAQQKRVGELLVAVVQCGGCGMAWRLETLEDAQPAIDALEAEAERKEHQERLSAEHYKCEPNPVGDFYREIARRIRAGYEV